MADAFPNPTRALLKRKRPGTLRGAHFQRTGERGLRMRHELRTERELSLDFLRVCEAAAIAAARTMGQGDRKYSDHVAVEAMREVMDSVPMRGRIVIGEGERDEAPMLYIGEEVGGGYGVGEDLAESCPE